MRLVIERMGGFDVIEDSERIRSIEVRSDGVAVRFVRPDADAVYATADHAEACRLAAAIAARCGTLVEALSEGPEVDGEEAMGAASAKLVRKNSKPWRPASEWVEGEPPKDGRWYAYVEDGRLPACVRWCSDSWRDWHGWRVVVSEGGRFTPISER